MISTKSERKVELESEHDSIYLSTTPLRTLFRTTRLRLEERRTLIPFPSMAGVFAAKGGIKRNTNYMHSEEPSIPSMMGETFLPSSAGWLHNREFVRVLESKPAAPLENITHPSAKGWMM